MKKKIIFSGLILIAFLSFSCKDNTQNLSEDDVVENLNGYWKIDKVERSEFNDIREYKFSTYAEYIEVDSTLEGFRIKLQPQLDSTFKKSSNPETLVIKKENDSLRMHYETPLDEWTETLIALEKDKFSVENERGFVYTYKRFESLKKELEAHE